MKEPTKQIEKQVENAYAAVSGVTAHLSGDAIENGWNDWLTEESTGRYCVGCCRDETREVVIYLIEAARCLCCGSENETENEPGEISDATELLKQALGALKIIAKAKSAAAGGGK